jgi:flagellar motor switch protein FliG
MPAPETPPPPLEIGKMSKIQKLAALLVILGPESAAQILKHLNEHELESISGEMTRLTMVPQELQRDILREFSEVAVQASTSVLGGIDYTKSALEKSVGLFRASDIVSRVAATRTPVAFMQQIADMDAQQIFNLIKQEQAQTIALVCSYLAPEKSSQILMQIRAEIREEVIERIANLAPTPVEVVEGVVQILNQKLGAKHARFLNQTGGIKAAADVLNSMDKNISKSVLFHIEEKSPDLGQAIRQKMFTFEDLITLDSSSLQKILREIEMRDLAVALKTASERLKNALLSCMSRRAADAVNEEISFLGPQKLKDIEAAQSRIIEAVRRLEGEGELDLTTATRNARDEVLV